MNVIAKTAYALNQLEYNLDFDAVKNVCEIMASTHTVTLTGVGKSLIVAQMGASLLQSVGFQASAVHATDMLHGSLGVLSKTEYNTIIFVSHSGETEELLDVMDSIETYGRDLIATVAVTGDHQSTLAERCKIALAYHIDEDGSKHGTIPTVSVAVQLAIINMIVCEIADWLTTEQLGSFHPGGSLHKRYEEITGE